MNFKRRSSSSGRLRRVTKRKAYKVPGIHLEGWDGYPGQSTRQKVKEQDRKDLDNW